MKKQDFNETLKRVNLTRNDFSELTGVAYSTISNWSDKLKPVPEWADSWLSLYSELKTYKDLQEYKEKVEELQNIITKY